MPEREYHSSKGGATSRSRLCIDFPNKREMMDFFEAMKAIPCGTALSGEDPQVYKVDPMGAAFLRGAAPSAWFHVSGPDRYPKKRMIKLGQESVADDDEVRESDETQEPGQLAHSTDRPESDSPRPRGRASVPDSKG